MKTTIWLGTILTVILASGVAGAEERQQDGGGGASGTPSTSAREQAQQLADHAFEAYRNGDYPSAIERYTSSYKLHATADVLFNLATIYDKKLGERQVALDLYRRHNASPDAKADLVGKSLARISALTAPPATPDERRTEPDAQSGAVAPSSDPGSTWRTAGIVTGVVGILGLGVGVVTGAVASGKHDDAVAGGCAGEACPDTASQALERDAGAFANLSTIAFIGGGALVAGGAAMYLLAPKKATTTAVRLAPSVDPRGGGGLSISGVFF